MSWSEGCNNTRRVRDVFAEFSALQGELTDEQAKATLCEFLFHNPAFLMDIIGDVKMFPMQELVIKGWARNDYNLGVWGRGVSKSWTVALFALFWAIFHPGVRIVIMSAAFRQSRKILEQCEKFINAPDEFGNPTKLPVNFPDGIRRGTDEWQIKVPNQATIICLPLGDGKKIRGIRADVLIVDEFAYLPETIIGEILRPFLAAKQNIQEQRRINDREDRLIAEGRMTEDQRTVLEDRKKVIFLSSACYQFEHMYKRYQEWTGLLMLNPETQKKLYDEFKASGETYFISRIAWDASPDGLLNIREVNAAKRELSESMFAREYGAQFTSDSGGYYKMSKMISCSVQDKEDGPCLELAGQKGAKYIVAIDVASSGAEDSDHFAISVIKLITRDTDGRVIPLLVHSYAIAGGNLKDHTLYLYYILKNFNVVYIAIDASQGKNVEFLNSSIQSELFRAGRIELSDIDAEFEKDDFPNLPAQIKKSYNFTAGRIVHKQSFHPNWQRAANEWMQACIDHRNMMFGGKIAAHASVCSGAMSTDISMLKGHEDFEHMGISAFIDLQDSLLDLTRNECATVIVTTTDTGTMQFKLPQNVRRSGGPNRVRKDNYSSLLLGVWAAKMYVDMQTAEVRTGTQDFPYAMIG